MALTGSPSRSRRLAVVIAVVIAALPGCAPRLDTAPDPLAVPQERWPAITDEYLRAMAEGDHSRAYDRACQRKGYFPMSREEFVAHHRHSLRPVSWRLERGLSGGGGGRHSTSTTVLFAYVTFEDGRQARIGVTVYERGVCMATSADGWARDAINPTPLSEALKRHTEGI